MEKILVLTSPERVQKYTDPVDISPDWELVWGTPDEDDETLISKANDARCIFADAVRPVSGALIAGMPELLLVQSEGVGYDCIDSKTAAERGVLVCNTAGTNAGAVAESAVLLMLAVLRRLTEGDDAVRAARQAEAKHAFIQSGLRELGECSVGIIGFGAIGAQTANRLRAFGSEVFYYSRRRRPPETEAEFGVRYLPSEELLSRCDIVSLHAPASAETYRMMNKAAFAAMKPGAVFINTARGSLVDQEALVSAIVSGRLSGAGLDTLDPEPVRSDNPLLHLPEEYKRRVTFMPHVGGTTAATFRKQQHMCWQNIKAALAGERPASVVAGG